MQHYRDQIRKHPYPRDLDHIAQEFGPQLDEVSCGIAAVHHGLLLGGLAILKEELQSIFRVYPKPGPNAYGYLDEERLPAGLRDLGLDPDWVKRRKGESTPQFLERLAPEMDRGAFAMACIYYDEEAEWEYSHWITIGRWKHGRIWVVDSDPDVNRCLYSLTPATFDACAWGNSKEGYSVLLVRPGDIWKKNYEEWLPGRDRLLGLEASATIAQSIHAAARALNDGRYSYEQLEFCLSEKTSLTVEVRDGPRQAIAASTPTANEQEGQVALVRRLDPSYRRRRGRLPQAEPGRPGPPELVFRISALSGWQLT